MGAAILAVINLVLGLLCGWAIQYVPTEETKTRQIGYGFTAVFLTNAFALLIL